MKDIKELLLTTCPHCKNITRDLNNCLSCHQLPEIIEIMSSQSSRIDYIPYEVILIIKMFFFFLLQLKVKFSFFPVPTQYMYAKCSDGK